MLRDGHSFQAVLEGLREISKVEVHRRDAVHHDPDPLAAHDAHARGHRRGIGFDGTKRVARDGAQALVKRRNALVAVSSICRLSARSRDIKSFGFEFMLIQRSPQPPPLPAVRIAAVT